MENKMNDKTINNVPVSDEIFNKMVLLQERLRRIEAESRLLALEKSEAEAHVKALVDSIEQSKSDDGNGLAQQVKDVAPSSAQAPSPTA
jgi:hypothetical protein